MKKPLGASLYSVLAGFSFLMAAPLAHAQEKNIAERLGYPADAKLVVIHADDLAVAHSVDEASFAALDSKAVSSASIMVPCPWLTEAADYAKAQPDADLGLHLTLTSEWKNYRWGPVAPKDSVASLIAPDGYFYADLPPVAAHATPAEVEREIRAQIELAEKMGIHPTHLDIHMGTLAAKPEFYAALVKVAHEHKLPFLAMRVTDPRGKAMLSMLAPNDIIFDSLVIFGPNVQAKDWTQSYVTALSSLKPGLHYLIVHLGYDDSELRAITVDHPDYGSAWRQRDFNAVTSPEFKKAIQDNHIVVIGWRDLKKLLQ